MPDTNLEYYTTLKNKSWKFLKHLENNFMSQVASEPTRKCALLELLFENRKGRVRDVMVGAFLGHSDHEIAKLKIFGVRKKKSSRGIPP